MWRYFTRTSAMRWPRVVLIVLLVFDVWYRGHTFGPSIGGKIGTAFWPRSVGETEPLDCDEAAYAYIGHRALQGDVLYRDLTENKPPLGYWLYALGVALGGYAELAIRIMPIPYVLATIVLVWWITYRTGGPAAACLAAGLYVVLSTDPYLFGNGANLEHFINFFSVAALALLIRGWDGARRWPLVTAGISLGAAVLVKQVAIVAGGVFVLALASRAWDKEARWPRRVGRVALDVLAFAAGLFSVLALAALVLVMEGAGYSALEDIFQYGRALATDTLPDSHAPSVLVRWVTGNADPSGRLPWPFGATDYLVWWGTGSWPLWLASIPAVGGLLLNRRSTVPRRLVAVWTLAAWAQVILPGLYWPHYYMLPIAGVAISVALCFTDSAMMLVPAVPSRHRTERTQPGNEAGAIRRLGAVLVVLLMGSAMGVTVFLQVRDYLLVPPEELTIRYKGGRQWVVLRLMGRELARRAVVWERPELYVWGWQSPLHFYARLDSPTRHFFVDNLLRDQADRHHPLIEPRTEEIVASLRRRAPALVFTGYPPFRALQAFLNERYLPSRLARGLWVRSDGYGRFETTPGEVTEPASRGRPGS
jgi:4-amino-4-deoxy-L-arabinose transferase-like glycosyltransferase